MNVAKYIHRRPAFAVALTALASNAAWARVGSGESYNSGRSSNDSGDSGALFDIAFLLIRLVFEYPAIGIPLLVVFIVGVYFYRRSEGSASTRKALDAAEAQRRTAVSAKDAETWVSALKSKDPQFDLMAFFDRTRKLVVDVQEAWFRRNLEPVRRFLSDSSYLRLATQLLILQKNGVRDAIADMNVTDLQIIGLTQTSFFDSLHVRVKASVRDADAPASASDDEARALAQRSAPEAFTEVWTFVRRPGATTDSAKSLFSGNCPNCGAPFEGGASNTCEFCGAIVNSGNYDWVLAEITQASEYEHSEVAFDGLARTRQSDPEFTSEVLEDRASLVFWKWIEAQVVGDASRLSKVATVGFAEKLKSDLTALDASGRQKVFLECAVGAVNTMAVSNDGERERASVEIRWSAKSGLAAKGQKPPAFPSVPQRWVFVLERKAGAQTSHDQGLSTNRCPQCHAPLSDNGQTSCEYCSTPLASGEREWVLSLVTTWEAAKAGAPHTQLRTNAARTYDREERERLLYLMASVAVADGSLDAAERKLLRMCAERWDVAWANVELALNAGPGLFDRLIAKGSEEAESFIRELVQMALVDGQIDRKERKLLETAATHLGLGARLNDLVNRATQQRSS